MNLPNKTAFGRCLVLLTIMRTQAEDPRSINIITCSETPAIMLVAGRTLDAKSMRDYAIAFRS